MGRHGFRTSDHFVFVSHDFFLYRHPIQGSLLITDKFLLTGLILKEALPNWEAVENKIIKGAEQEVRAGARRAGGSWDECH